jgi:hypothetical protein
MKTLTQLQFATLLAAALAGGLAGAQTQAPLDVRAANSEARLDAKNESQAEVLPNGKIKIRNDLRAALAHKKIKLNESGNDGKGADAAANEYHLSEQEREELRQQLREQRNLATVAKTPDAAKPDTGATSDVKPEPKADTKTDGRSDAKSEPRSESKSESKSDSKPESRSDSKSESKSDSKTDSSTGAGASSKPRTK